MPDLEHFSLDQVDKSLDPCTDFFQYACSKWIKANPIPPDQGGWGTFNSLAHLEHRRRAQHAGRGGQAFAEPHAGAAESRRLLRLLHG